MTTANKTLDCKPDVDAVGIRSSDGLGTVDLCECGSEMIRRKSGEMLCASTAKTYEVKYGQKLE